MSSYLDSLLATIPQHARPTNAITDMVLCFMHMTYLLRLLRRPEPSTPEGKRIRLVAILYLTTVCSWQTISSWMHVYVPTQAVMSTCWFFYLAGGAAAPCLYGGALCLDQLSPAAAKRGIACFALVWAAYVCFAACQCDVAAFLPFLPTALELTMPPAAARAVAWMPWMNSALRAAGQRVAGESALTLHFDGRGYAGIPFAEIFDAQHSGSFDLYTAFPCWRAHSLSFLFLFFGVVVNSIEFVFTAWLIRGASGDGAAARRRQRASWCFKAHAGQNVALYGMPVVMFFRGCTTGIDFLHLCSLPGMHSQCCMLEQAVADADASVSAAPKKAA